MCTDPFPVACTLHANLERDSDVSMNPLCRLLPTQDCRNLGKDSRDIPTSSTNMVLRAPGGARARVSLRRTPAVTRVKAVPTLSLQGEAGREAVWFARQHESGLAKPRPQSPEHQPGRKADTSPRNSAAGAAVGEITLGVTRGHRSQKHCSFAVVAIPHTAH